jgi:CBS-domain-containing membrane protein
VNAVPVIDARGNIAGIVAKDDLLSLLYPNYDEYVSDFTSVSDLEEMERKVKNIGTTPVRDIMKKRVVYAHAGIPIMRALSRMIVQHVDQLPVLSDDNRIIGIISKGDIFKALFKHRLASVFKSIKRKIPG